MQKLVDKFDSHWEGEDVGDLGGMEKKGRERLV